VLIVHKVPDANVAAATVIIIIVNLFNPLACTHRRESGNRGVAGDEREKRLFCFISNWLVLRGMEVLSGFCSIHSFSYFSFNHSALLETTPSPEHTLAQSLIIIDEMERESREREVREMGRNKMKINLVLGIRLVIVMWVGSDKICESLKFSYPSSRWRSTREREMTFI
jgi:hypothetical protein